MPTIRNVAPCGDLDVPLLRRVVAAGEAVEVTADQAWRLLPQDIWEPVDEQAKAIQADIDVKAAAVAEAARQAEHRAANGVAGEDESAAAEDGV